MKLFSFEWVSQLSNIHSISVKSELFKEKLTLFAYFKKILQSMIDIHLFFPIGKELADKFG